MSRDRVVQFSDHVQKSPSPVAGANDPFDARIEVIVDHAGQRYHGGVNIINNNHNNKNSSSSAMGLSEIPEQMSYYPTLTREEKARMHPCKKAKCVMMSASSSPSLQPSVPMAGYVELPDEPRPGKITPSTPTTNTTNSSPSPRASKSETTGNGGASSPEVEEAIEEAVPIVRSTLPSPEPRPLIERNGFKGSHDRVDGNGLKAKPVQHDVDDDSCLIKCVYFTQQCCECVIV